MRFEWDDTKNKRNLKKHGVSFEEAQACFLDAHQVAFYDPDHSDKEYRELLIAHSSQGRLLCVVYTLRQDVIRIISARVATRRESNFYAQGI